MKRKRIITGIIIFLVIIITLPILIDWLILGNDIPSNVSNADWIGFLGGYVGAILGAIVSLIGIMITIKYTNEQNKQDRELQIRPYCSIRYVHDDKLVGTNKVLAELPIGCEPKENNGKCYTSILYIKNIGLGPAVEFDFDVDRIDDGRKHYPILMQRNASTANRSINLLQPGEEGAFPIYIYFNFDPIKEEDFIDMGEDAGVFQFSVKDSIMTKYKNFDITIHVKYCDMYQNQYYQKIVLSSNMHVGGKMSQKQAEHLCDINLEEITIPVKIERSKGKLK